MISKRKAEKKEGEKKEQKSKRTKKRYCGVIELIFCGKVFYYTFLSRSRRDRRV